MTRNVCWSRVSCVCVSVHPSPHAHTTARTQMLLGGMVGGAL